MFLDFFTFNVSKCKLIITFLQRLQGKGEFTINKNKNNDFRNRTSANGNNCINKSLNSNKSKQYT